MYKQHIYTDRRGSYMGRVTLTNSTFTQLDVSLMLIWEKLLFDLSA